MLQNYSFLTFRVIYNRTKTCFSNALKQGATKPRINGKIGIAIFLISSCINHLLELCCLFMNYSANCQINSIDKESQNWEICNYSKTKLRYHEEKVHDCTRRWKKFLVKRNKGIAHSLRCLISKEITSIWVRSSCWVDWNLNASGYIVQLLLYFLCMWNLFACLEFKTFNFHDMEIIKQANYYSSESKIKICIIIAEKYYSL